MIGCVIKCKIPNRLNAYNCIQLLEASEAGMIINSYWLIINTNLFDHKAKYKVGEYVRVIDIRCFDIFGTDINYDSRNDLIKIGNRIVNNTNVNIYSYKELKP